MLQEKQYSESKCEINDAELFISSIAGSRDAKVSFQYFDDKKQGRVKSGHCHGTLAENFDFLSSINFRGAGIYMMVNEGDLNGRSEENVTAVRCVFVDLDGSDIEPARQAFLKPHLITKTSTDDSGREHYQVFWRINPIAVNDANRLKIKAGYSLIQNTLAEQSGGDKKITEDLCRVMRLPGFYHMKGHPQLCSIIEANDHPSFDYTDVIKAFDIKPPQAAEPHLAQENDFTEGQITEGDRNAHCFTYACQKVKQGLNEDEVYACLITENAMRCVPPLEDDEVESIVKSAMKYRRKHSLSGKRFEPSVYVSEILLRNHVISLYGEYYKYQDGVYKPWNDTEIKGLIWNWSNRTASVAQIESTVKLLGIETYINPDAVNPLGCLNLRSGILNTETGELAAHDPKRIFTIQIPVSCPHPPSKGNTKKLKCPQFQAYLNRVLPDRDQQALVWEMLGYFLTTDCRYEKAFLMLGPGHNGKTVLLDIVRALLRGYVSELRLADLGHSYRPALLQNKLLNITAEGESSEYVDDVAIKSLISGEDMTIERKYCDPVSIKPYAKLIVAANSLPRTKDKSYGYFRRWIPIAFDVEIPLEERDEELAKKIVSEELDEIFYGALLGLRRLRKNRHFTIPVSSNELLDEYEKQTNPVITFLEECISDKAPYAMVSLASLYARYKDWCLVNGHHPMARPNLRREVERKFKIKCDRLTSGDERGKYGFVGLQIDRP
ncbi:MAG: phage/plasmid primase, P4 family [Desulfomonilaceae bacterium]